MNQVPELTEVFLEGKNKTLNLTRLVGLLR